MPLALAVKHAGAVPPMRIWVRLGEGGGGGFMYSVKVFNSTQFILYRADGVDGPQEMEKN